MIANNNAKIRRNHLEQHPRDSRVLWSIPVYAGRIQLLQQITLSDSRWRALSLSRNFFASLQHSRADTWHSVATHRLQEQGCLGFQDDRLLRNWLRFALRRCFVPDVSPACLPRLPRVPAGSAPLCSRSSTDTGPSFTWLTRLQQQGLCLDIC
jgi:hypothetical protein